MLRTSFINDLEGEFSNKPTEDRLNATNNAVFDKQERERISFEEDNFMRLPIKKKEKIRLKKKMRQAMEDKIDDFKEMENIREVLKMDGMIEEGNVKVERKKKLQKTLALFNRRKPIRKFHKKK